MSYIKVEYKMTNNNSKEVRINMLEKNQDKLIDKIDVLEKEITMLNTIVSETIPRLEYTRNNYVQANIRRFLCEEKLEF